MANESGKLLVKDLDPDDLNLLREGGVNLSAFVREAVHARATELRAEQRAARRREVLKLHRAERDRFGRASTEEIVEGIHADRRAAGWE